jgi:hypothetical protein
MLKDDTQIGYEYFGAGTQRTAQPPTRSSSSARPPIAVGKRVIGYNDGSVNVMEVPELPQSR